MSMFWVVGGRYASTKFDKLADDATEEKFGPFDTYAQAEKEWQRRSWQNVDNCYYRYRVVEGATVN